MSDEEKPLFRFEQGSHDYRDRMKLVNARLDAKLKEQEQFSAMAGISVESLLEQYQIHGKEAVNLAIQAHGPDFLNYLARPSEPVDWTARREEYEDQLEASLREGFKKLDRKEAPKEEPT